MPRLNRIILYVRNIDRSAAFYARHFSYSIHQCLGDRLTELIPKEGGSRLMLHKAGKAQKLGQTSVKLVFDVQDVAGFCQRAATDNLSFGSIHQADGYQFANAKDPDGNALQVTSRPFRIEDYDD